jgi:ABC-type glutathione transport system ATPase component
MNAIPASADQAGVPTDDVLLAVRELHVRFGTEQGTVNAVNGVSFDLHRNEVLCIVGESGSGKSSYARLAILGLLPRNADVAGDVIYQIERCETSRQTNSANPGRRIAMVFQDSLAALHPLQTVGNQVAEAIRVTIAMSAPERPRSRGRTSRPRRDQRAADSRETVPVGTIGGHAADAP